jgi:hypothetical protein
LAPFAALLLQEISSKLATLRDFCDSLHMREWKMTRCLDLTRGEIAATHNAKGFWFQDIFHPP